MKNPLQNKIKKGIIMALTPLVIGTAAYAGQKESRELANYAQNNADKIQHIRQEINGETIVDGKVYTSQKGGIEVRSYPDDLVIAFKESSDTAKVLYDYGTDGTLDLIVSGKDVEVDDFYKVTPQMIKTAKYVEDMSGYQSTGSKWTDDSVKKTYFENLSKDEKSKFNKFYDGIAQIVLEILVEK